MNDEPSFLAAIEAHLEDRTTRLVYADWLEERGDPRSELIRVEERMHSLAIASDEYWALKPRRDKLRDVCALSWLERMDYGVAYEPVFGHWPDDWRSRWRLVREFVERWYHCPMPDVGGHADKVRAIEESVGLTLPPSVREWVAFERDTRDRLGEDFIRDDINVLRLDDLVGIDAVSLMEQAEGDCWWAVRTADLGELDPPVIQIDEYGPSPGWTDWGTVALSVSMFVILNVTIYGTRCRGHHVARGSVSVDGCLADHLRAVMPVPFCLGFEGFTREAGTWLFEGHDLLVHVGSDADRPGPAEMTVVTPRPVPIERIPPGLRAILDKSDIDYRCLIRTNK